MRFPLHWLELSKPASNSRYGSEIQCILLLSFFAYCHLLSEKRWHLKFLEEKLEIESHIGIYVREFQELGETLNTLSRSVTGFQPKRRRRQKRYKGKQDIEMSNADPGDGMAYQNRADTVDLHEGNPSSMTTTINTTTEEIQKQTMAGISKVRLMRVNRIGSNCDYPNKAQVQPV